MPKTYGVTGISRTVRDRGGRGGGQKKFRFKHKLVILDSTVIHSCLSMYDRAKFRTKDAVELHLVLDHDGYLPCFGIVTEGSVHDEKAAQRIHFSPGTVVVDDRGYNDYRLLPNGPMRACSSSPARH